jgi:CHAT domain-containing protein
LHKAKGTLAVRQHRPSEVRQEFQAALEVAESALDNLRTERDRAHWAKDAVAAYRELIRIALDDNDGGRALTLWQVYRSAGITSGESQKSSEAATALLLQIAGKVRSGSILSMIQFDDRLDGWLIDNRGVFPYRSRLSRGEADAACSEFRALASTASSDVRRLRQVGQRLYDALIGPVETQLRDGQPLAIQADGPCAGIPFEVLVDKQGSYLVERLAAFTAPGAFAMDRLAEAQLRITSELHAVVVGDPRLTGTMTESFPELPDAAREASMVAGAFRRALVLTGRNATLGALQTALPTAEIFHFAGHGVSTSDNGTLLLSPDAGSSGAALLESSEMDGVIRKCRLAVLSACHSAAGERLGPFNPDSLVQSMWRSGVPHVVATRWAVDSRIALELVTAFYRTLLTGRQSVAALRAAQREILSHPATAHPAYWAAFHVFGSSISVFGETQR